MSRGFDELKHAARFTRVETWGDFLLGAAEHSTSLYELSGQAVHFDLEGRWVRARLEGRSYLRGLDGAVLERFGAPDGHDLRVPAVREIHDAVGRFVDEARARAPLPLDFMGVDALMAETARFRSVYRPVGIMPPDRYRSLVVQVTNGCAFNQCRFCALYKAERYRAVPADELRSHVRAVKAFMGSQLIGRRGVFLGEANAMAAGYATLNAAFEVIADELPELAHDVSSFVDAFDSYLSSAEIAALRVRGLARVFLGLESGDPGTLELLGKPNELGRIEHVVREFKRQGVSTGVILLAGLGARHVAASVALIKRLDLDEGDVVYVSPLVADEGPLERQLTRAGVVLGTGEAEARELKPLLAGRAKVARYDVRRWIYT